MSIFPDADEWNIVDTGYKQNGKNKSIQIKNNKRLCYCFN